MLPPDPFYPIIIPWISAGKSEFKISWIVNLFRLSFPVNDHVNIHFSDNSFFDILCIWKFAWIPKPERMKEVGMAELLVFHSGNPS
jgi:hypothetical protein